MAHSKLPVGSADLSGTWELVSRDGRHSCSITLPGDVHSALQQAGLIPDPYFGRNEEVVQWVAEADWLLSRSFTLAETAGDWYLDIDYVDTVAEIRINDTLVAKTENCFQRYRRDVTKCLKAGENRIEILIHSSVREGAERQAKQPFLVPHLEMNSPIPNGNMLRKPQCHFGWDWNIAIAPLGVYGRIALSPLPMARIEHVVPEQIHHADGRVELTVRTTLFAKDPGIVALTLDLDGESVRLDCATNAGLTEIAHVFEIEKPRLWWPAGSGEQALYTLTVAIPGETITRRIGLRSVRLLTTLDEAGSRFALEVNGREIFARGSNWIPADALFSRSSPDKTHALLQSAVDAHMNMIRVWGGGFYEFDDFYETCDALGLMVWQDFMFACNLYPSTQDFLDLVEEEVTYQVRRLASHPSIVLWCGDNELVGALNWFDVSRQNRDRYLVSYDRLNRTVERALTRALPSAIWWPSSPASGYLDYGDAWHADGSGDMHFWSVWHENKSFDHYRTVRPRFCSEFGFQSYTSLPVVRSYAEAKDMNIASPVMELHQKNRGGNERIAGTMFRYFRFPKDFANFVYLSQIQQALAIETAVDYWRSLKPHCMGTVYWQLNDTWPVASWASLDYGGGWKALHHKARHFFQPVHVAAIPSADGKTLSFSAINDTADPVSLNMVLTRVTLDGTRHDIGQFACEAPTDLAHVFATMPHPAAGEQALLSWRWTASNGMTGEGHHVPSTYKALDLEPAGLSLTAAPQADGSSRIEVKATGLALFVMLEADQPGRFSDNIFDLARGESRSVDFIPHAPTTEPVRFRLYDLHSCQSGEAGSH